MPIPRNIIQFGYLSLILGFCFPAIADEIGIGSPEGTAIAQDKVYVLSMGVDSEFSNTALDGAIYEWRVGEPPIALPLSVESALTNPTSLVVDDGIFYVVDGAAVLAIDSTGNLRWRTEVDKENTFLYDIIRRPDGNLLVTDFGNGIIYQLDSATGNAETLPQLKPMVGLARLEYFGNELLATTWGTDDEFDGTVYRIVDGKEAFDVTTLATGFSNLEGIQLLSPNSVLVGTWRGHVTYPNDNLFEIDVLSGEITPYVQAGEISAPADFSTDLMSGKIVIPVLTENRVWMFTAD